MPLLSSLLLHELAEEDRAWLELALTARDEATHEKNFAEAATRFSASPWVPTVEQREFLDRNNLAWLELGMSTADMVGVLLFVGAVESAVTPVKLAERWYLKAAGSTRRVIVRALSLLPNPKSHVQLALLAVLSPDRVVSEAICLHNPYASRYFSDLTFEQLVERTLFLGFDTRSIAGLEDRLTPTLRKRLAADT